MPDIKSSQVLPLGRDFAQIAKYYFGALAKRLGPLEHIRYYSILIFIDNSKCQCTQQFISDELKIDKVSMVRMIEHLENNGYIDKILNPDDRRAYLITLSKKGKKIMPELYQAINDVNNEATKGLTEQQQNILTDCLQKIQQNLEALPFERVLINYKKANPKI